MVTGKWVTKFMHVFRPPKQAHQQDFYGADTWDESIDDHLSSQMDIVPTSPSFAEERDWAKTGSNALSRYHVNYTEDRSDRECIEDPEDEIQLRSKKHPLPAKFGVSQLEEALFRQIVMKSTTYGSEESASPKSDSSRNSWSSKGKKGNKRSKKVCCLQSETERQERSS
mmetsp:Transcript_98134/g.184550  ORF Transcript_98134/g.184550 Transcript_98134/m.184550 type:complete len:169 (+) Transcript_98134:33-539(+)